MSLAASHASSLAPGKFVSITRSIGQNIGKEDEWITSPPPSRVSLKIVPTSSQINVPTKSSTKIEEKFRRYVSEGDLLLRSLSKHSEDTVKLEDLCDSKHLFERNTESFRCLAQLYMSSSSLSKNRLFLFPALEDPGIDTVFMHTDSPPVVDDIGAVKYKKLCTEMEIVPMKRIIESLKTDTIDLKYAGLSHKQIKALTDALKANTHVRNLFLQENWLTVEMTQMISDMLVENTSLQIVSLYECRIGEKGAQKLGEVLSTLQTLKSLDLRFNEIGDQGLLALRDGLCENLSLKTLNLSHNNITEDSAEAMEKIFLENRSIEEIDLSWCGFFTPAGNKRLFNGLMQSDRIRKLNLAWNGLGVEGAVKPLARYLKHTEKLEELDISSNRLGDEVTTILRGAINKNISLVSLKIGNNLFGPAVAHSLLTLLIMGAGKISKNATLLFLDMENMYVKKESKMVLKKIRHSGKVVKIGGILSDYEICGPDLNKLIYERCRYILQKPKSIKAKKDFGHFILNLPETPITQEDFKKDLKKQKIKKLDKDLVEAVMHLFMNKKNQIECQELVQNYMSYYPDTKLPPPKPKKAKKGGGKKKKKKLTEQEIQNAEQEIAVYDYENNAVIKTESVQKVAEIADRPRQSRASKQL